MAAGDWLPWMLGTKMTAFKVGRSTLDATGLTAARTHTLPDAAGTLALAGAAPAAHAASHLIGGSDALHGLALMSRGVQWGLEMSNGTDAVNDIDILEGVAVDQNTPIGFLYSAPTITKRLDAVWAVGTGNGGLDTGSIGNKWYYVWVIRRSDTGVVDAIFTASVSTPTMPANYDQACFIGPIWRVGGSIVPFINIGNLFRWVTPILDVDVTTDTTSATSRTLSVPLGYSVEAIMTVFNQGAAKALTYVRSPDTTDQAPSVTVAPLGIRSNVTGEIGSADDVRRVTGTSGDITTRSVAASTTVRIVTHGWVDLRR